MDERSRRLLEAWPFGPRFLATGFFSGLAPHMPGTAGSLVAVLLLALLPPSARPLAALSGAVLASVLSVRLAQRLPGKAEGGDPGWFVMDEWAGQWLTLVPFCATYPDLLLGFVAFRVFDMTKPPPVRRLERIGRGFGILLDDLAAALYALAALAAASLILGVPTS